MIPFIFSAVVGKPGHQSGSATRCTCLVLKVWAAFGATGSGAVGLVAGLALRACSSRKEDVTAAFARSPTRTIEIRHSCTMYTGIQIVAPKSRRQVIPMRAERFDALTLGLSAASRRGVARGVFGALLVRLTGGGAAEAAGPRTCLINGKPCHRHEQCCSKLCRAKICQPRRQVRSCPGNRHRCGGKCVNLAKNRKHCGGCGRVCRAGYRCQKGKCVRACPPGLTACGRRCVNLRTDFNHCGRCKRACPGDQRCAGGRCVDVCTDTTCGDFPCGVLVERKPVCSIHIDGFCGGECWPSEISGCKPCSKHQDCPPPGWLVAPLCLYTHHTGLCGVYEFACGWMS